jgi:hypothetical protein
LSAAGTPGSIVYEARDAINDNRVGRPTCGITLWMREDLRHYLMQ